MEYKEFKNKNEYQIDDKRFIKEIKRCNCIEKVAGKYALSCKINERGEHIYNLSEDFSNITKDEIKKFWLGDKAKKTVRNWRKENAWSYNRRYLWFDVRV